MGEQALRRLAVRLPAENAAAIGGADHHRHRPLGRGAVADLGDLADDLVVAGVDVIGELDLDDGLQAVAGHANGGGDDATFADRRIEHAGLAELALEALGDAEDAAEIARVLAEHDHVVVGAHRDFVGVVERLDHVHLGHQPPPSLSAWSRCSARFHGTSE